MTADASLVASLLPAFSQHLANQMGLYFAPARQHDLLRGLERAAPALGFAGVLPCLQALLPSAFSEQQVQALARYLCVGETYFFREPAVFNALEQQVLPALIERRRQAGRTLRLWSAGCSTGEEPYTLAMVLARLLPDLADWDIQILATDIQPEFLARAAEARYSEWSFRSAPPWLKAQCFERVVSERQTSYRLQPRLRRMVQWRYLNLLDLPGPAGAPCIAGMDIVFCRNVLMYFEPATAAAVVRQLHQALAPGGWLVVSPTETGQSLFGDFVVDPFPGTTFYRKQAPQGGPPPVPATPFFAAPGPDAAGGPATDGAGGEAPPAAVPAAVPRPASPAPQALPDPHRLAAQARALANQGRLAEAWQLCETAMAIGKFDPALRYLAAAVLDEQGQAGQAVLALQKALFLEPGFVLAHLALGHLYRRQGHATLAARHLGQVRTLLAELPGDAVLPCSEGLSAGQLLDMLPVPEGVV